MSDSNGLIENILTSFANGTCRLIENKADALEDRLKLLGSQLQIVDFLFENLAAFGQTKVQPFPESIYTGSILFTLAYDSQLCGSRTKNPPEFNTA